MKQRTTRTNEPRRVYRSSEGRVEVYRNGPCDFSCFCDGELHAFARRQDEAELAGLAWLTEQAETMREIAANRVELGGGDYALYVANDGYRLYMDEVFRGSYTWPDEARAARNVIIRDEVRRPA